MYRNRIVIVGRMTANPEIRTTPKGKRVAQFSVAQNYRVGEDLQDVNYFEVQAWEPFTKYIESGGEKGRPIFVEGHIKTDRWDDKQGGGKKSKQVVVMDYFHFIDLAELTASNADGGDGDPELDQADDGR